MKTNKQIIIEEIYRLIVSYDMAEKDDALDCAKEFATNLLSKLQTLDRGRAEDIFKDMLIMVMTNFCDENGEPENMAMDIWEENENDFNILINQICQLIPGEGEAINKWIKKS